MQTDNQMPKIKEPVIIIGCPRSGTSLLFRILSTSKNLWSLFRESNDIWANFYRFTGKDFKDEVLTEADLTYESKEFLLNEFHKHSIKNYYLGFIVRELVLKKENLNWILKTVTEANILYKKLFLKEYRLVEKTPKNCFRIPFINKLFDNCRFIFIKRDGRTNINSLIEGWNAPDRYIRRQAMDIPLNIKGYCGKHWKYVLPPLWENYTNKPLEEVCAYQWVSSNKAAIEGLKLIEEERKLIISYEDLTENTYETIKKICNFANIPFSKEIRKISQNPPVVNFVTKPQKDKWKKNIKQIEKVYPIIEEMMKELGYELTSNEQLATR